MENRIGPISIIRDRFQWGSYGFIAGIILGLFLGWFFHGAVDFLIRFGFVALAVAPLIILFLVWRRLTDRAQPQENEMVTRHAVLRDQQGEVIDADSFVIDARTERQER
ncbi:MAG: hypothetical protein M3411_07845 [Chloroflexota bacterium]|nr:hypothetical protein [Chloroflexota bacterium]